MFIGRAEIFWSNAALTFLTVCAPIPLIFFMSFFAAVARALMLPNLSHIIPSLRWAVFLWEVVSENSKHLNICAGKTP